VVEAFDTVPSEVLFGVHRARIRVRRPSLVYYGSYAGEKTAGQDPDPGCRARTGGCRSAAHGPIRGAVHAAARSAQPACEALAVPGWPIASSGSGSCNPQPV